MIKNCHSGGRNLFMCLAKALTPGVKCRGMKRTTRLYLLLRLRVPGAVPPLPKFAFMAWCLIKQKIRNYDTVLS